MNKLWKSKLSYIVATVLVLGLMGAATNVINWKQINPLSRHGTGAYGQASDGTGTSGHCAQFSSDGSMTDAGGVCTVGGSSGTTIWSASANPNGSNVAPTNMTSNTAPGPYTASSYNSACNSSTTTPPYEAFTGSIVNGWNSYTSPWGAGTQQALEIDLGSSFTVVNYSFSNFNGAPNGPSGSMPSAWLLQGSAAGGCGGTWSTLDSETGVSWTLPGTHLYSIATPASWRHYRLWITANANSYSVSVGNFQLNTSPFTSGVSGDWYFQTGANQWYGPRTSGGSPTWAGPFGETTSATGTALFPFFGAVQVAGATFTATGCSNSTLVGGASAGSYHSGTTGACAVVITTGLTASHGWACSANDLTTNADIQTQTATSTNTATISGTTVTGDIINFHCIGY